jgi:hypothetical protein
MSAPARPSSKRPADGEDDDRARAAYDLHRADARATALGVVANRTTFGNLIPDTQAHLSQFLTQGERALMRQTSHIGNRDFPAAVNARAQRGLIIEDRIRREVGPLCRIVDLLLHTGDHTKVVATFNEMVTTLAPVVYMRPELLALCNWGATGYNGYNRLTREHADRSDVLCILAALPMGANETMLEWYERAFRPVSQLFTNDHTVRQTIALLASTHERTESVVQLAGFLGALRWPEGYTEGPSAYVPTVPPRLRFYADISAGDSGRARRSLIHCFLHNELPHQQPWMTPEIFDELCLGRVSRFVEMACFPLFFQIGYRFARISTDWVVAILCDQRNRDVLRRVAQAPSDNPTNSSEIQTKTDVVLDALQRGILYA